MPVLPKTARPIPTAWLLALALLGCSNSASGPRITDAAASGGELAGTGGLAGTATGGFGSVTGGATGTGGVGVATGGSTATGGVGATTGGTEPDPQCDDGLLLTLRDFTETHPDFESFTSAQTGIVEATLGTDKKPVYAHLGGTGATTGPTEFDQWYRDVDGVNMRIEQAIAFTETSPGVFVYDNSAFFPLDGMGFGNGPFGAAHNFLFTTEAHTLFTYRGGEQFTFRGDDDLWIFINGQLAVDLGGTHSSLEQMIDLDLLASQLGIVPQTTYPMDIFHAERHTVESNFRIETTIDLSCIANVDLE